MSWRSATCWTRRAPRGGRPCAGRPASASVDHRSVSARPCSCRAPRRPRSGRSRRRSRASRRWRLAAGARRARSGRRSGVRSTCSICTSRSLEVGLRPRGWRSRECRRSARRPGRRARMCRRRRRRARGDRHGGGLGLERGVGDRVGEAAVEQALAVGVLEGDDRCRAPTPNDAPSPSTTRKTWSERSNSAMYASVHLEQLAGRAHRELDGGVARHGAEALELGAGRVGGAASRRVMSGMRRWIGHLHSASSLRRRIHSKESAPCQYFSARSSRRARSPTSTRSRPSSASSATARCGRRSW